MPAAVAAYISTATLTAASVLTAGQITAMTYAAFAVGSVAVGNYQRRKAKAKAIAAYNAGLEDRLVSAQTTMGARSRCYGRVRNVDGVLFRATRGANKEFYTMFIAVAGHEIDGFETIYFNDVAITADGGTGFVTTAPYNKGGRLTQTTTGTLNGSGAFSANYGAIDGSGSAVYSASGDGGEVSLPTTTTGGTVSVTGGPPGQVVTINYQTATTASKARVRLFTGAPGQNVGAVLAADFPSLINSTEFRFAGIAGILVDFEYDPDVYPSGIPNVTAVFRGARVFDPVTSTTVWSENPALIARDWALYAYGGGMSAGDLVAASFTAARNVCATSTTFPVTSGSVALPAFTCSIVARLGEDDPWQVFQEIVESMAGKAGWPGGQLKVVAGSYRTPVGTITEDWLTDKDDIQIIPEPPTDEAVNVYRAQISDSAQQYNVVQAPEVRATSFITADGRELPREITLGGVTDTTHAQHVCSVLLRDARNALSVVLPLNLRGFQLELFDVVSVTLARFGWSAKTFEIIDWRFSLTGGVVVTLKETAAAIFTPDSTFAVLDVTPNTQLPSPFVVPTIGALTITSAAAQLVDGTAQTRVSISWTPPSDQSVTGSGSVEIQYWPANTALPASGADWLAAPPVPGNASTTTLTGLRAGIVYLIRARFINALGIRGLWGVQAVHQVANIQPPSEFAATRIWQWTAGTADGWTATGATLTPAVGSITLASTGTDPNLHVSSLSVNGAQNQRVRVRLRRLAGAGWQGDLYYTTSGHGVSESFKKTVPNLLITGQFAILEWDMSALTAGGTDWTSNTITGLRFDFGNTSADQFQIDWVAIGYIGPATEGAIWDQNISGIPANVVNATSDLTLIVDGGNMTVSGNVVTKTTGVTAWDNSVYSRQAYTGGCVAEARIAATNTDLMIGLNSDPATNASFNSIDYAIRCNPSAVLEAWNSGSPLSFNIGTYAAGDVIGVKFDGYRFEWFRNGVVLYSLVAAAGWDTQPLYLDSSFSIPGGSLSNIRFYAVTRAAGLLTEQMVPNLATDVVQVSSTADLVVTSEMGFTGSPSRRRQQVISTLTFVAPVTGSVFLEFTGGVEVVSPVTDSLGVAWTFGHDCLEYGLSGSSPSGDDFYDGWMLQLGGYQQANITYRHLINMSRRVSVVAGRTYTVTFGCAKYDNTVAVTFKTRDFSAQVIKL